MDNTCRVRVVLNIPKYLIPEGEGDPVKALEALITAALLEFRISVVYISKHDARNLTSKKKEV